MSRNPAQNLEELTRIGLDLVYRSLLREDIEEASRLLKNMVSDAGRRSSAPSKVPLGVHPNAHIVHCQFSVERVPGLQADLGQLLVVRSDGSGLSGCSGLTWSGMASYGGGGVTEPSALYTFLHCNSSTSDRVFTWRKNCTKFVSSYLIGASETSW